MAKLPIPFDNPATYPGHSGVDYPQPHGTPFRASGPGRVTWLGHNSTGGYFIWVQYDDIGPQVGYHHMPSHRGCPPVGSRVVEGTVLGHVGSTGRSTGPHLHSEVRGHRSTAGYWKFFDPNRVVSSGGGAAGSEDIMNKEQEAKLDRILARVEKGLTGPRIAAAVWSAKSGVNGRRWGDMLRTLWDDWRIGRAGHWHHGTGTADFYSEIGAQKNFRARYGDAAVDVKALAAELAPLLNEQESDELVKALLAAQGKALTEASKAE